MQDEVFNILSFWMDKGLDGLRLDAIAYLFERDELGGESLPETVEFVEKIRSFMDTHYPEAVLIAEANQPPKETMEYYGSGNRFHMVFNFPVMPRLYQALALGDATPVYDILNQLPPLPEGCQWGTFLRNHDELTLEMVDDDVRELMYQTYLPEEGMRAHVGIARRLMPLMGGDRRKVELMFSLLMTLPGAPFIYYGDEIGMLDDTSLPDRYAVRTPMQWDDSETAGFSARTPARLPIVGGTSVESQLNDATSLLHSVRTMITERHAHPELGTAPCEPVETGKENVLGYQRGNLLCLHNFSDRSVDLGPVELGPYGYAWLPA